ncbi:MULTISPECIES: phospholipase A(1) [Rhizobium/Agrobacterium group]|uniref:Phospholipase A1 n=2 Tax=Rhizobium/Agrobacterium group TaxID=227290 RepID=B9K5L8_ALLAM|nr:MULTISPECIES: phospholipase A(1) [Rhizobium/Agrobacterium group]ACM40166.1 phospholipase A1 [Allorhizobium ampelinum S4]MCF1449098.1 phospholipase [Allorhizobium ampelinum]MCF1496412.1 phospholipase [Allorhizobium ampelinum]MUO28361.1 phospholipase [Agrobacterium vitis]MUO41244.1 phospholipase [Agrobacterium vitis]
MATDDFSSAGTAELDPAVQKADQRPSNNTTTVSGDTSMDRCLRRAAWLIFDVYDQQYSQMTIQTRPMLADVRKNWSKVFDNQNKRAGYRAVLYRPNGSDGDRATLCPPALIFRGSDLNKEELSGLAITIEIEYHWDLGLLSANPANKPPHRFEFVFAPNPDVAQLKPSELAGVGFTPTSIVKNDAGNITLRAISPTWIQIPVTVAAQWNASITVWTKDQGDWATNFRQGVGLRTTQYDDLTVADARKAAQIAMNEWGGRLMIIGHSLGGGLASLAACVAQKENPTLKLAARTFNAAGLHPATAARQKTSLSAATVRSFAVEDEILTTLQKRSCPIPLITHILRWAGKTMPEAITGHAFERRRPGMDDLWPVQAQEFPMLTEAERIAASCSTLSDFVKRYVETIWSALPLGTAWNLYKLKGESEGIAKRADRSVGLHLMPDVVHTYPDRFERYLPPAKPGK